MPLTAQNRFTVTGLTPIWPDGGKTNNGRFPANVVYAKGTVLGQVTSAAVNDVQTLTVTGTPTGGTLTLYIIANGSVQPLVLPFNSSAAAAQTAIQALANVGAGNMLVTGGALPGSALVFTAAGSMLNQPQTLFGLGANGLTGGASPAFSVAHTFTGVAGSTGTAGTANYVPGAYAAYASGNADGTQVPRGLLEYDIATDSFGNVTFGTVGLGGEHGEKSLVAPFYYKGSFRTTDLVGLDTTALAGFARLVEGVVTDGVITLF